MPQHFAGFSVGAKQAGREVTSSGALLVRSKSTKQLSTPPAAKLRFFSGFSFEKSDPWSLDDSMSYESGDRSGRGDRFCGRPRDPRREGGRKEKKAAPLCRSSVRPLSDLVSGVTFAVGEFCISQLHSVGKKSSMPAQNVST